jgi:hypothetical protein
MGAENTARLTDPSYISDQMFDRLVRVKFHDNADDAGVRDHATKLVRMIHASKLRSQILADILHAAKISRNRSPRGVAEIGFAMGVQCGFELALTYPPLGKDKLVWRSQ